MEEQNATPDEGGASTLDRISAYLSGQEKPPQTQSASSEADDTPETDVEPADDGQEDDSGPQLTTSDLASILEIDEANLVVGDDGKLRLKTKIDGAEGVAKLAEVLKSYQLEGHVNKKSMEIAEREKQLAARAEAKEKEFTQRIEYAEGLTNIAARQLMQEFQSVNWQALEQQDPGAAALWRQKFQERQAQLRGVFQNIEAMKAQKAQESNRQRDERMAKEAARLPELIPEWKDAAVASRERTELAQWIADNGIEEGQFDLTRASTIKLLRTAMLHERLQKAKPEIENKVRKAPVIVKPGQPNAQPQKTTQLQNLKLAIKKSGGKRGIADYLIASGKV